jgi:hypothetical protein
MACGAISESQSRATSAARALKPPSLLRPLRFGGNEAERRRKQKPSFANETSGFATLVVSP